MKELKVGSNEAGQRLDKYLKKALPNAPVSLIYKQLRQKNITLNRKKAQGSESLNQGDLVQCFFSDETFGKFSGEAPLCEQFDKAYSALKGISVLYEDKNILIVNKPAGILTQKARPEDISLNEWMIGYLLQSGGITKDQLQTFRPSVCNRLDRNTSGMVLCGKSLAGSQALNKMIQDRRIGKYYRTICHGMIDHPGLLTGRLDKDHSTNTVTISVKQPLDGSSHAIRTGIRPIAFTKEYSLLEVELITGKTHQIRAHLASIGHPILGDRKYGDPAADQRLSMLHLDHYLLHAQKLVFPEWTQQELPGEAAVLAPLSGQIFEAPLPGLFQKACKLLFPKEDSGNF